MWTNVDNRRPFAVVIVALSMLAWLALWVWSASPYAQYLSHDQLRHAASSANWYTYICGLNTPNNQVAGWVAALLLVASWTLMTIAMMLPTSLPLLALFHRMTRPRADRRRLVSLLIAGYLGTWLVFGVLVHVGHASIQFAVEQSAWLSAHTWLLGAATLLLAGVYQFTPLKYACLDKCRSPLSFIVEHWQGRREQAQSFRLGVHHGLFCIGCCWSLMLLMFVVGMGNIAWMLVLGIIMAAEKNMPWGRRLVAPLGVGLLACGVLVLVWGVPVA